MLPQLYQSPFADGRHLAAARVMAGLKQIELADLAGLHVNSLKRLEAMDSICGGWAVNKIHDALLRQGIVCQTRPTPSVYMQEGYLQHNF